MMPDIRDSWDWAEYQPQNRRPIEWDVTIGWTIIAMLVALFWYAIIKFAYL